MLFYEGVEVVNYYEFGVVYLDWGIWVFLVVGVVLFFGWVWGVDLGEMISGDMVVIWLVWGVLSSIVILLVVDFFWQVVKIQIDWCLLILQVVVMSGSEVVLCQV